MDQRNKYTFYANRDGYYRFDFSEMRAKCGVRVCVKNKLGENISGTSYCENEGGVTVELSVNESPYTVYVEEINGYTEYYMQIGIQKEMVPIVDNVMIIDSMQFIDQQNIYKYIPTTAGEKTIAIRGIQNDVALYLAMYDHLGYLVTDERNYISGNQETVQTKKLDIGEEYLIKIEQKTGFSKYSIKIGN